jgi:inositol transporter-like SP family MFS transporter
MASYLDAGSIVALGAGLAFLQRDLHLTRGDVGVLVALGPNAIGCAVGALIGGWLGDKFGRKAIYQYDLILYAVGVLCVALAPGREVLLLGTLIMGLAVGADVPTSLALVGELAPAKARGKLLGLTIVAWSLGPVVVLMLALFLAPLGLLGIRIIFLHLFVVALGTWAMRRGLAESALWKHAAAKASTKPLVRTLFAGANLRALVWTTTFFSFWGLAAGTAGIFTPYIITTLHAGSQKVSIALAAAGSLVVVAVTGGIFMPLSDRSHATRKMLWAVGSLMQIAAYGLYLFVPFSLPVIAINILLASGGGALAGGAFYNVFSQELFPTLLRGTAQGLTLAFARLLLGIWSFFVPVLASAGIRPVAAILTLSLVLSGVIGFWFMPDTAGKSLEQLERERFQADAR